ncbi:MAG TPA: NAD-dependent epimerase/dehydratase family protein [Candidatus Lambdaproteobacteria bacterium]|nr:NAD-dependent epimerase/dehydratase family protein [Candidatus Lambdaproteobacteria bacterium]
MTSFVTGATGFIGQRLLVGLEANGEGVRILSRNPHPDYETVVCDLQSEAIPEDGLDGVDTVFHLAGFTHDLRDASKLEHLYRALNVDATVRLTELAVRSGVKQFVFVSSVKAGGYDEEQGSPDGVYGQTKREAELKLLNIGRQSEMLVSIVRPSLVYGAGVKGNLALMRRGIEQGWFPPIPETENRRSMIHVDDLVRALLLTAEDKRANGEIFIVTDGVPHSSREIYEAICQSVGKTVPQWSVPKIVFEGLSLLSPRIRYKVDKLLGDEFYSSAKLEGLGFRAEKSLLNFDR